VSRSASVDGRGRVCKTMHMFYIMSVSSLTAAKPRQGRADVRTGALSDMYVILIADRGGGYGGGRDNYGGGGGYGGGRTRARASFFYILD
jgi:hypothetical protein